MHPEYNKQQHHSSSLSATAELYPTTLLSGGEQRAQASVAVQVGQTGRQAGRQGEKKSSTYNNEVSSSKSSTKAEKARLFLSFYFLQMADRRIYDLFIYLVLLACCNDISVCIKRVLYVCIIPRFFVRERDDLRHDDQGPNHQMTTRTGRGLDYRHAYHALLGP